VSPHTAQPAGSTSAPPPKLAAPAGADTGVAAPPKPKLENMLLLVL